MSAILGYKRYKANQRSARKQKEITVLTCPVLAALVLRTRTEGGQVRASLSPARAPSAILLRRRYCSVIWPDEIRIALPLLADESKRGPRNRFQDEDVWLPDPGVRDCSRFFCFKARSGCSRTSREVARSFAARMEKRDTKAERCRLKSSRSWGAQRYSVELGPP